MLDLCYEEDSRADVDMNVVMTGAGKFVEVQATAEHAAFDDGQMAVLIELARAGIARLPDPTQGGAADEPADQRRARDAGRPQCAFRAAGQ